MARATSAELPACGWCGGPNPDGARRDVLYCRQHCRQAAWRFTKGWRLLEPADRPLRFAYADPPYPEKARIYKDHRDYAGEVDHAALIARLEAGTFDGWALSTSAAALKPILDLCPPDVRVGAWFRGERPAAHRRPLSSWEPVIYRGARDLLVPVGAPPEDRRLDAVVYPARPRRLDPDRVTGAKPARFCWWLFDLLGVRPGDTLVDVFPGSGGIARAFRLLDGGGMARPGRDDASPSTVATDDASSQYSDLEEVLAS